MTRNESGSSFALHRGSEPGHRAMSDKANIGVFVCECGVKIAGRLDVSSLARQIGERPDVAWAGQAGYWCSPGGLERMRAVIADKRLDRVVIAGCAPRTHEPYFRRALDGCVNPTLVSMMNLRDLNAGPHQGDPEAMTKAGDQVIMSVADLAARQPGGQHVAHITPHAAVIGGGIAGLTAALSIAEAGISVTLVEREQELGGLAYRSPDDRETADLVARRMACVRARSNITVLTDVQVADVSGSVGCYQVTLSNRQAFQAGAIIVAIGGEPDDSLFTPHSPPSALHYAFVLCDMTPEKWQTCLHSCCLAAFRQVAEIKRLSPASEVTVFFRELYTAGGTYDELVWEAQRLGVSFCRYPAGQLPQSAGGEVVARDELTGRDVHVRCDRIIHAAPMSPHKDAADLARLLRLPLDGSGFIADTRVRLRPADRIERGLYVCGAAHYPCDAQRATFEAYSAAARAVRHIRRGQITHWASAATIDAARCNGCGDCAKVCPFMAVTLEPRSGIEGQLAVVDSLICTGCGNCVSVCPVKAAQVASATDEQLEAQIRAALDDGFAASSPCHLVLACEWSGYSAAEIAGAQGLAYPATTRIIRLNCTGRLQPGLILKALEMGAACVMILGCAPGVCHYEQGNERCAAAFDQANALSRLLAMDDRLKLEWVPPDDGARFVQLVQDFVQRAGPLASA